MNKTIPITKDGVVLFGGDYCYSIEKGSDPFGPKDNIVARLPCGLNGRGELIAMYEGLGGKNIQSYRLISECYSTREIANNAKIS